MSAPLQKMITAGSTSQQVVLRFVSAFQNSFVAQTSMDETTSGLVLKYWRVGDAAWVSIAPAAVSFLSSAWTSGGIEAIADGYYRVDVPNAAFARDLGTVSGAVVNSVLISGLATNVTSPGAMVQLLPDGQLATSTPQRY